MREDCSKRWEHSMRTDEQQCSSSYAWPSTIVCMEWDRRIVWDVPASRARRRLDVVTCDQQTVDVTSRSSLQTDVYWQNSMLVRLHGAVFVHIWKTKRLPWTILSVRQTQVFSWRQTSLSYCLVLCSLKCFLFAIYWHSARSALEIWFK